MREAERCFIKKNSITQDDLPNITKEIDDIIMRNKCKWEEEDKSYNKEDFSDTDDQSFDEESDNSDYDEMERYEDTDDQSYDEMSDRSIDDKMKSYEECSYCDNY